MSKLRPGLMVLCLSPLLAIFILFSTAAGDVVYVDNYNDGTITRIGPDGRATIFASGLSSPAGMAVDSSGNLYVGTGSVIRRITSNGTISTFASISGGVVDGLAFDGSGNLYAASESGNFIDKITPGGTVSTFMHLNDAVDPLWSGSTLYFTVPYSILKSAPDGTVTSFATFPRQVTGGIAGGPDGNLYAGSYDTIYRVTPNGRSSTFVQLPSPNNIESGMAFDSAGNLYAPNGNTLFRIAPDGTATAAATGLHGARYVAVQIPEPGMAGFVCLTAAALLARRRQ